MTHLYIKDLQPGQQIQDTYMVTQPVLRNTAKGDLYIAMFLSDKTGKVNSRMWQATQELYQAIPSEGDGLYTVTNQSDGITSVDSRGRTITRIENIRTAYSQTELEIIGDRQVVGDQRVRTSVSMSSGPNPFHFHYEVARYTCFNKCHR